MSEKQNVISLEQTQATSRLILPRPTLYRLSLKMLASIPFFDPKMSAISIRAHLVRLALCWMTWICADADEVYSNHCCRFQDFDDRLSLNLGEILIFSTAFLFFFVIKTNYVLFYFTSIISDVAWYLFLTIAYDS